MMANILPNRFATLIGPLPNRCGSLCAVLLLLLAVGCHTAPLLDTTSLDSAGMSYDSIQKAKSLNVTQAEVAQLAKARSAGFSDSDCITLLQIFRARNRPFDAGDSVAGLIRARMSDESVIQLATLNQLGVEVGELQAMRLAGIVDATILEVARQRAAGKIVLGGASLANMKNAGMGDATLQELVHRGVSDSQLNSILALRRHGESDAEILRHFPPS
jgi:hypothetical protein